jgi:hypothetical protein
MKQRTSICLLALAALPFVANAQPATGDWELTLGGAGNIPDSNENLASAAFQGSLGYYLTDQFEVGGRQGLIWNNVGDTLTATTQAFLDYNFNAGSPLVPFIGANVGVMYGDGPNDFYGAPEAGIKWYIREKTFILAMAEYRFLIRDGGFSHGNWALTLGLGVNL